MSLTLLAIAGLVSAGVGVYNAIDGAVDEKEAKSDIKKMKAKYPDMDIPQSIVSATDLAEKESQRSQVAGYDQYRQQIEGSTAQGISAAKEAATSAADLQGAITSLYGQQSQSLAQLEIEGARQQQQSKQRYGQQLNTLGSWQQQQYLTNEYQPWVANMNSLQSEQQQSYDQMMSGISMAASGLMTASSGMNGGNQTVTQQASNTGYVNPGTSLSMDTSQYQQWGSF